MQRTLDALLFRVTDPETGLPEGITGSVITALNEEAVCAAALGNKGGINIVVTYEAFGTKMHGAVRQEVVWAEAMRAHGREPAWLTLPLVLTSHTWENAKNEHSHQDPSMSELMLGECAPSSRVLFVPDYNSAATVLSAAYQTRGQYWTLVIPKASAIPDLFTPEEASSLLDQGALRLDWASDANPEVILTAIGAYQLEEVLKAARRLRVRGVRCAVVCMLEPGRFRAPRTRLEAEHAAPLSLAAGLYPTAVQRRVFASHTRPHTMSGVLQPLNADGLSRFLGFQDAGGTLSTAGMLFVNRCTWAHIVESTCQVLGRAPADCLSAEELAALRGELSPHGVIIPAAGAG